MRASKVSRWIAALGLWSAVVIGSGCSDPQCPRGYTKKGDTCYRIRDAGQDAAGSVIDDDNRRGTEGDEDDSGDGTATSNSSAAADGDGAGGTGPDVDDASTTRGDASPDGASSIADAAQPEPVDPCRGLTGCVACAADNECPDPGACLVRRCNASKGICEPAFAPEATTCGASKCDGAGRCVGCLNDSDCGNPGECKTRYCNPSTRVCEPKNASTATACPGGHCDQGICVQCSDTSECADRTCQTRSCVSGQCRYINVPPGQPGNCSTGSVCTSAQLCRECETDAQCGDEAGECTEGRCMNNACRAVPKTGSCGPLKMCTSSGTCEGSCNNGVIDTQAGEQCDPMAAPWNSWTCDRETCRTTGLSASAMTTASSFRRVCGSNADCATREMCVLQPTIAALLGRGPICVPQCEDGQCRRVSGYLLTAENRGGEPCSSGCVVECTTDAQCPPGVQCTGPAPRFCAGPFY